MDLKAATPSSGILSGPLADVGPLPRNAALEKPFLHKLVLGFLDLESQIEEFFLAFVIHTLY